MKNITRIFFSLLVGLLITFSSNAQSSEWIRVESETKDLSVAFPPDFVIYKNKKDPNETLKIYAFQNGVLFKLRVFREGNPKERLKRISFEPNVKAAAFSKNKVEGKISVLEENRIDSFQSIYLASNKSFYKLEITAPSLKQKEVERFLLSIKVSGDPIFTGNKNYLEAAEIKNF